MERVDLVLVGVEVVVESGGIINTVGRYSGMLFVMCGADWHVAAGSAEQGQQQAVLRRCAAHRTYLPHTPAVAESFKFVRTFPLTQADVATHGCDVEGRFTPAMDYTPPAFITLLVTDIGAPGGVLPRGPTIAGVLTPSAVSDELIKLYL